MKRTYFHLLLATLLSIEVVQILFCLNFLDWFKEHKVYPIYPILFAMSFTALGVMTYFLIRGIYSITKRCKFLDKMLGRK